MKAVVFCIMHTTQYCRDKFPVVKRRKFFILRAAPCCGKFEFECSNKYENFIYKIINALQVKRARINFVTAEANQEEKKKRKKFIARFILEDRVIYQRPRTEKKFAFIYNEKLNNRISSKRRNFFSEKKNKQRKRDERCKSFMFAFVRCGDDLECECQEEREIRHKRQFYHRYPPPLPPRMPPPRPFYPQGRYGRYGRYEVIRPMARYPGYMRPYF
ncbi:hypothetical protein T12_3771 [Trichinella patagoniensis]|uniref:Uncharacterized protein n=1 Tax=Trichinella patagoniensis TaxID=990121 RepID=A0A0V1A736_9BILA|nr:hypothetical protein T12_3771 [Trichinella patagoniensis]